jgi:hypothetical protein
LNDGELDADAGVCIALGTHQKTFPGWWLDGLPELPADFDFMVGE